MNFYNMMENQVKTTKSLTENGAIAYKTSGSELLDYNFHVSALRAKSEAEIQAMFERAFYEDKIAALRYLFYLGDIREGIGERKQFRACMSYLIQYHTDIALAVMPFIPEYNRFDSLMVFVENKNTHDVAIEFLKKQIETDKRNMKEGKPVSLCAKWMPSENASSKRTRELARNIISSFKWSESKYRKTLSALRDFIGVTEVFMSAGKWASIDYSKVPSKANLIYQGAFLRNDKERREAYLESLKNGTTKINAKVLQPHEIVYNYMRNGLKDAAYEEMWKSLPAYTLDNVLVVRDGSYSMTGGYGISYRPLDVATALAIYMADHNSSEWKNKFITFSSSPKIVDLSNCKTLRDKIRKTYAEDDCSNTNIYKTMKLILNTAIENNVSQEEMPKMVVICSDMQFDGRYERHFNYNKSLFDTIKDEYKEHGYLLPKICFWNLSGNVDNTIPMQENDLGMILCSGFSVQLLKMFMSNQLDPYKILLEAINQKRYDPIENAVKHLV